MCLFFLLKVDENVTRYLDKVLKRGDWDVLIFYYFGLDYIGYVFGFSSFLIGRKFSEMDGVLMKIYIALLLEVRCVAVYCVVLEGYGVRVF